MKESEPNSPTPRSRGGESAPNSPRRFYNENGVLVLPRKGVVPDTSPGPGAYSPSTTLTHQGVEKCVFGSSKQRERPGLTYISSLHSSETPSLTTPGPGTYRLPSPDKVAHMPCAPNYGFGTALQRDDSAWKSPSPGPKYDGDPEPVTQAPKYSFAPHNPEQGLARMRDEAARVLISSAHSRHDRTSTIDVPGPAAYDAPPVEVLKSRAPTMLFGTASRQSKDSLAAVQLQTDATCGSAAFNPGPQYEAKSMADPRGIKFDLSPRTFYPERGNSSAGPFISRLHADPQLGSDSPGPALYEAPTFTVEHAAYAFPGATTGRSTALAMAVVPGPGAYRPLLEHSSKVQAVPSFSMGCTVPRLDMSFQTGPGPAAYDINHTTALESRRTVAPAYSLGLRTPSGTPRGSGVPLPPGPSSYSPRWNSDAPPLAPSNSPRGDRRGYSFGGREKLRSNAITTSRYHGPLDMQSALGMESPGPKYDTSRSMSAGSGGGALKFGTSLRESMRGLKGEMSHLPGPGSYNVNALNLASVSSRFKSEPGGKFSRVDRFNNPAHSK